MQSYSSPPDASMMSGIAIHEGNAGQLAEADARSLSENRQRSCGRIGQA